MGLTDFMKRLFSRNEQQCSPGQDKETQPQTDNADQDSKEIISYLLADGSGEILDNTEVAMDIVNLLRQQSGRIAYQKYGDRKTLLFLYLFILKKMSDEEDLLANAVWTIRWYSEEEIAKKILKYFNKGIDVTPFVSRQISDALKQLS